MRSISARNTRWRRTMLCAAVVAALLAAWGCSRSRYEQGTDVVEHLASETAQPSPEEKAPPPKPIELGEIEPVELLPSQRVAVPIEVQRNGATGPLKVAVAGLPEGVSAEPLEIAAGKSAGTLALQADASLGGEELAAEVVCRVECDGRHAQRAFALRVARFVPPEFGEVPPVLVAPGARRNVEVPLVRNDFDQELTVTLAELPEQMTAEPVAVPAGADQITVPLVVPSSVADGEYQVKLRAEVLGRTIERGFALQVSRQPYRIDAFRVVRLIPGEEKEVTLPVERSAYRGPLHVELENLPPGVTVEAVDVPAGANELPLRLAVAADARPRVRSVKLASRGGALQRSDVMIVRVVDAEGNYLPPEIVARRELAPLFRRGSFGGRLSAESKAVLVDIYGGTAESEAAVLRGLEWLALHQAPDGCWSLHKYDQARPGCDCRTEFEAEVHDMDTAGTALGLLPFLGAGVTHLSAPEEPSQLLRYRTCVRYALSWLMRHQVSSPDPKKDGHLGGNMYAHALGTMALCEAYGLTGDQRVGYAAQRAIRYMMAAQHTTGGGWRYSPGQAGDMSVTGWVFLAIRDGQLAGLQLDKSPFLRAERFLDSCSVGPEPHLRSQYCYQPGGEPKLALTAAGLLARQYLGWRKENPDLAAGCEELMKHLPPASGDKLGAIYFYYYATQVLHHMEADQFDLWNHRMREHLIRTQETSGHAAGSWNPQGSDHGAKGGRIYSTSLAVMTLEVYYRHLPMYRPVRRGPLASQSSLSGSR